MKNIRINLSRLVREYKTLNIEVPDDFHLWGEDRQQDFLHLLYEEDDGDNYKADYSWGADEGTHSFWLKDISHT